jgi:DNA-binding MarR family transcriptional regulator
MPNDETITEHTVDEDVNEQDFDGDSTEETTSEDMEDQEINLLQALLKKGPALPIELAVRTYSYPEEIAEPLSHLEQKGLVERQGMKTGEMIVLTQKGHERVMGK